MDEYNGATPDEKQSSGFMVQEKDGNIIFRFQTNTFNATSTKSMNFIYPVPKLAIITDGEALWEIGKNLYDVKKGDIIILRPGTIRHFEEIRPEKLFTCDIYEFLPIFLYGTPCINLFMMESTKENTVLFHSNPAVDEITAVFTRVKEELAAAKPMAGDMIRGLMMCGFSQIIRAFGMDLGINIVGPWNDKIDSPLYNFDYDSTGEKRNISSTDHSVGMTYVLNMIRSNISGDLSIDELADAAHMSRSHFFKVFRKYNGISVNDYILKCRVENTVKLLLESKCNILDAAYASGFTSSSGFYKAFRKITGKTPKDYLKEIKANWENITEM